MEIKCIQSSFNGGYAAGHRMSVNYAIKNNFEFIWTSEATMSKTNSIFRSIDSLAEEFANQSKTK